MKTWARRGQGRATAAAVLGVAVLVGIATNGASADDDRAPRSRTTVDSGATSVTDPSPPNTGTTLGETSTINPTEDGRRDKEADAEPAAEQEEQAQQRVPDAVDQQRRDDLDRERELREAKSKRIYDEIEQQFLQENTSGTS